MNGDAPEVCEVTVMMAGGGGGCRYYRLNDLLRLASSACDDTGDALQTPPDPELQPPSAESAPIDLSRCLLVLSVGGGDTVLQCLGAAA